MKRKSIAWLLLTLFTLAGLDSIYWLLFAVWMMAYPFANQNVWRPRLYEWFAISFVIGIIWVFLILWLIRMERESKREARLGSGAPAQGL